MSKHYNFLCLDGTVCQVRVEPDFEEGVPSSIYNINDSKYQEVKAVWTNGALVEISDSEVRHFPFVPGIVISFTPEFCYHNNNELSAIGSLVSKMFGRFLNSKHLQLKDDVDGCSMTIDLHSASAVIRFVQECIISNRAWFLDFAAVFFGGKMESLFRDLRNDLKEREQEIQ